MSGEQISYSDFIKTAFDRQMEIHKADHREIERRANFHAPDDSFFYQKDNGNEIFFYRRRWFSY